jgi:hypothetical protein
LTNALKSGNKFADKKNVSGCGTRRSQKKTKLRRWYPAKYDAAIIIENVNGIGTKFFGMVVFGRTREVDAVKEIVESVEKYTPANGPPRLRWRVRNGKRGNRRSVEDAVECKQSAQGHGCEPYPAGAKKTRD